MAIASRSNRPLDETQQAEPEKRHLVAFVAPMLLFLALLAMSSMIKNLGSAFWLRAPEYWIYPLQTALCAALLLWFRCEYSFAKPRRIWLAVVAGAVVFVVWISPQAWLGFPPRTVGFNPELFRSNASLYWFEVVLRFLRLAVVVPFVEEIFWRGFLLRYLIDERFSRVPFGAFTWLSFAVVTLAFTLVHAMPDWPAALICGATYNGVAYATKSLASCVVAHAVTNLLLGIWIMQTQQWGFW